MAKKKLKKVATVKKAKRKNSLKPKPMSKKEAMALIEIQSREITALACQIEDAKNKATESKYPQAQARFAEAMKAIEEGTAVFVAYEVLGKNPQHGSTIELAAINASPEFMGKTAYQMMADSQLSAHAFKAAAVNALLN